MIKVSLWGAELGYLKWDEGKQICYFVFGSNVPDEYYDIIPLLPLESKQSPQLIYGIKDLTYKGLPPFISDSVPDKLSLFKNKPLPTSGTLDYYKQYYSLLKRIGCYGIGALEYGDKCDCDDKIEFDSIDDFVKALDVNKVSLLDTLNLKSYVGGRQPKLFLGIHNKTGNVYLGNYRLSDDYENYILKFCNEKHSLSKLEMAYYEMAKDAGINVVRARLLKNKDNYLLIKRFDIQNGCRLYTQTLAALCPYAESYESLIEICKTIGLKDYEISDIFCRLVFNVLANNTDDHNRNFSFVMNKAGEWKLAPAYDMSFTFDYSTFTPIEEHSLSICGIYSNLTKKQIISVANKYCIRDADCIIDKVEKSVSSFKRYAIKNHLDETLATMITEYLDMNLIKWQQR